MLAVGSAQVSETSEPGLIRVTEACHGTENSFTNTYQLLAASGEFRSSRQWVGANVGYLQIQHHPPPRPVIGGVMEQVLIPIQNVN